MSEVVNRFLRKLQGSFDFGPDTIEKQGILKTLLMIPFVRKWSGRPEFNPGRVIPKTFKMVLDTSLLTTQKYKVRIEGKVEQSSERSNALPYNSVQ